jgi:hypothetical protein
MKSQHLQKRLRTPRISAIVGNRLIMVSRGSSALRDLRANLFQLSFQLAARAGTEAYLILDGSGITRERLEAEWNDVSRVLQPELLKRLTICVGDENGVRGFLSPLDTETQEILAGVLSTDSSRHRLPRDRGSSWYVVTKMLLASWFRAEGPVTTDRLMQRTGYSYPTVAGVLAELDGYLERTSDRRVGLRQFSRDVFERWLAEAARVRRTARFTDRSRTPRSPEALADRLAKLRVIGLAIGGVPGAKHYYPELDIVGTPRLDLSQHFGQHAELDFVTELDPALTPIEDPLEPARLVVHGVTEADAMFEESRSGLAWASPLECLLDLHEAKLAAQAGQFLKALLGRREMRA